MFLIVENPMFEQYRTTTMMALMGPGARRGSSDAKQQNEQNG